MRKQGGREIGGEKRVGVRGRGRERGERGEGGKVGERGRGWRSLLR